MQTSGDLPPSMAEREFLFGAFRFIPARHLLLRGDEPVRVGSRALDILGVLLERPGEIVTKRELLARAWPASVVEESNLKVHVAALRRALGDVQAESGHILTVRGRGYCFAHPVEHAAHAGPAAPASEYALPIPLIRPIGRDAVVATLAEDLVRRRLLTVVGPGGIGKTTVALATAEACAAQAGLEVCFVDLSRVADGQFVAGTLAAALGLTVHSGDAAQAVLAWLRTRRRLIVLDSCENVIDAAATLAQRMAGEAPGTVLLATSREPLRIPGEHVHHLAPLGYPAEPGPLRAAEALQYTAVQLFVERAAESRAGYRLTDADATAVGEICRRLEGVALAIELAATRIEAFGATELAARLDDRFRLLRRGRRGSMARHHTLEAALDWTYAYLPESEQAILRGLAVFAQGFGMDAAIAVLSPPAQDGAQDYARDGADGTHDEAGMVDSIGNLVAKSLLAAHIGADAVRYRLLDTTRAYALEKLEQCGETARMRRRHALYTLAQLQGTAQHAVDDLRAALAWAFGANGDTRLGIALTVAAVPLWMRLSLVEECRAACARALASADEGSAPAPADAMRLYAALAGATLHTCGPLPECGDAWLQALDLAERLDDDEYRLRALWGLAMYRGYVGQFQAVLPLAERFRATAARIGDRVAAASVERLIGTAYHSLGDEPAARRHLELMLRRHATTAHDVQFARFQIDQQVATLSVLGNVCWVMGYPDRARHTMREALRMARQAGHTLSLLGALANAACLAVRSDDAQAPALLEELGSLLARNAIAVMDSMLRALRGLLALRSGDTGGVAAVLQALDEMRASGFQYRYSIYMGMLAEGLDRVRRRAEARALIDDALAFALARDEGWCLAELWRIKGGLSEDEEAAACYASALEIAGRQQARLWALRSAASLVRLEARLGRAGAGTGILSAVYAQFDEGFDSQDLLAARALLDAGAAVSA